MLGMVKTKEQIDIIIGLKIDELKNINQNMKFFFHTTTIVQ